MKSLLRSSFVVLMVFAGFAAFATELISLAQRWSLPMCVPPASMSQGHANFACQKA